MPTYNLRCGNCGKETTVFRKMSELDEEKSIPCDACNGERSVLLSSEVQYGDPIKLGIRKVPDGFKEVLSKIHERTPGSNLNQKLSRN